jgi:hypothetical protein
VFALWLPQVATSLIQLHVVVLVLVLVLAGSFVAC